MAPDVDRARSPGELQMDNDNRFRELSVDDDHRRHCCGGTRDRDNRAAGRSIVVIYVPSGIEIVVVMDGRTVMMIAILSMIRNGVNMERHRLCL